MNTTWIKDNRFLLILALLVALMIYGVELGNFTLSIDEEVAAYEPASWRVWLNQGRWGMSLLLNVVPNFTYIPFLATLLFCIFLGISAVYFAKRFFSDTHEAAIFVVLFVASPVWLHVAEFNTLSWGVGIGLICCVMALHLQDRKGLLAALMAGLLVGFATAIYQALLVFHATLMLMFVIRQWMRNPPANEGELRPMAMLKTLMRNGVSVIIAIVFYLLVQKLAMVFAHGQITHVDTFVHINDYLENPVRTLATAGHKVYRLLTGTDASFLGWGWAILLLPWLGCLYCLRTGLALRTRPLFLFFIVGMVLLVVLATFSLVFLAAGSIPLRAIIGFPLLCAALGTLGFRLLNRWPNVRVLIVAYSLLVCIWMSAFLFGLDRIARTRDEALAVKISAEIDRVAPRYLSVAPVVFVGQWTHEPVHGVSNIEIFGTSFFQQEGGNTYRIVMFMRLNGAGNLEPRPLETIAPYMAQINRMPSWPKPGAVAQVGDVVVVKLSAPTSQQAVKLGL